MGPTCSGKTELSINLARKLNTEIISADSRQIYNYLNIGTAKPSADERRLIKHHLIDVLDPNENYNASRFAREANEIILTLHEAGKIPIVAGGSGLYIKALIDGIIDEADTDEAYRNHLYKLRAEKGNAFLYLQLKKIDPDSASKMLPQNWKRVIRALEVYKLTGKPISYFHSKQKQRFSYNFLQFGLAWDRSKLYENINARVEKMMSEGYVNEVKNILAMGYDASSNALNSVGYREIISYLNNEIELASAVNLIKRNTRHFAKRQITWFKRDNRITWLPVSKWGDLALIADKIEDVIYTSASHNV